MKMRAGRFRQILREIVLSEGAVSEDYAREIMKRFSRGMSSMGITPTDVDSLVALGSGMHGTAFETPDGNVIKVTNDASEAQAAAALVGQSISSIVHYYDVWEFGDTGLYGLAQEKLVPLEKSEGQAFNDALISTGLPIWIRRAPNDWDKIKELTRDHIFRKIKKKYPENFNSPAAQQFTHEINAQWNELIHRFHVRDMFRTLTNLGIDFHDYHAGNLMKRPGTGELVLIDLGISVVHAGGAGKMKNMTECSLMGL